MNIIRFLLLSFFPCIIMAQNECDGITIKVDKFKKETTYSTPMVSGFSFQKVTTLTNTVFRLGYTKTTANYSTTHKGITILAENDKRISYPDAEIKTSRKDGKYFYNTTIQISQEDINLLLDAAIADVLLDTFEVEILTGKIIRSLIWCLLKSREYSIKSISNPYLPTPHSLLFIPAKDIIISKSFHTLRKTI